LVYHHHYKGGTNDKKPLNSDQTLLGALDTAEGKLVVARQICNRFCPFALVPWSATLSGLRKRIEQLHPNLPDHRNQKVAKLDLLAAYKKGHLRKGTFADISTSSKFDTYFPLDDVGVEAADFDRGLNELGISGELIKEKKQACVGRAEFLLGCRGGWWPPICEFVDIWSGDSDNLLQVDFDGEIFGEALKKQAPAPAQAAAPAASSQAEDRPPKKRDAAAAWPASTAAAWPAATGEVQKESGVN